MSHFRNLLKSLIDFDADVLSCLGDIYYSSVLEEMKLEGQDFKADSWSMAVDSSYLQTHSKTVIKRQDVIYGTRTSSLYEYIIIVTFIITNIISDIQCIAKYSLFFFLKKVAIILIALI